LDLLLHFFEIRRLAVNGAAASKEAYIAALKRVGFKRY
jgi:hypothetical protein